MSAEARAPSPARFRRRCSKDVGCDYVIVGHSERRALYGESDQLVARKFGAAQSRGLMPILCVGEQLADREADRTEDVVARQLDAVLELCGVAVAGDAVIAYEPVWAIGTGRNATPEQAQAVHAFIRARVAARMLESPPICGSCTAAASRPAMRRSSSRCPMSTVA